MPKISYLIIYFMIYSFLGWIIESIARTIIEKKGFINSGFLHGPFIPIYGVGAISIVVMEYLTNAYLHIVLRVILYFIICNIIEYITGLFYEKMFHVKLWDYSNHKFNINGKISLTNSFFWLLLICAFLFLVKPFVEFQITSLIPYRAIRIISISFVVYFSIDLIFSFLRLKKVSEFVHNLMENRFENIKSARTYIEKAYKKLNIKMLKTMKKLRITGEKIINKMISLRKVDKDESNHTNHHEKISPEYCIPIEFGKYTKDLLNHEMVKKMGEIKHHDKSILDHCLKVAITSYRLAKKFNMDVKSISRGALLHDFHLYDWRTANVKNHPFNHPIIALENAEKYFNLNPIEKDIIRTHMWPLSTKFYSYKESFLVSMIDKYISLKEVFIMMFNFVRRTFVKE